MEGFGPSEKLGAYCTFYLTFHICYTATPFSLGLQDVSHSRTSRESRRCCELGIAPHLAYHFIPPALSDVDSQLEPSIQGTGNIQKPSFYLGEMINDMRGNACEWTGKEGGRIG